jgi:Winged helix-turn helix
MHEEHIPLGTREQRRAVVLTRVVAGDWTPAQAALALGLSGRQVRRLLTASRARGPAALVHGNRGRAPANRLPAAVRERIVALAQTKYAGFNHQHLTEALAEAERLPVGRTTVRRVLLGVGLGSPRSRRAPKHCRRRGRAAREGLLLQADGSRHRWLGPDGPWLTLVGGIDDATGTVPSALFRAQEDAQGYLLWLREVATTEGLPHALYVDRHGSFRRQPHEPLTLEEELAGGPLPTQVGRVLAELGIRSIHALSPQATGRVERLWGTFQDRLCSALRLAGARTLDDANRVLWAFLPRFNARFGVPAAEPGSAYRPLPPALDLAHVFCFRYQRVVANDNSVRLGPHRLQLLPGPDRRSYARVQVEVHERLDGSLAVDHHGRCLATQAAPAEAPVLRIRGGRPGAYAATGPTEPAPPPAAPRAAAPAKYVPPPTHPWKQKPFTAMRPPRPAHPDWR